MSAELSCHIIDQKEWDSITKFRTMNQLPVFAFLVILAASSAKPVIVDPLPTNLLAIENGKTKVSCTVEDSTGAKPTKIQFVRYTKFGDYNIIYDEGPGGRIQYENKTENDGKRLTSTLHINNVLIKDDSANGEYQCQGFVGSQKDSYGFAIYVIGTNELPGIAVSENRTVKFGDEIILRCNLTTTTPETTRLRRLMWAKDGEIIDEVLYPREESLKSRVIKVTDPSDGGLFSCHLISQLRKSKDYNITDSILITVQPKYFAKDLKDNEIKVFKGDPAKLVCSAKGNPLKTYWKKKLKKDGSVELFDMEGNSTKYDFSYVDKLEDHSLTIKDTEYSDRGFYYCCIQELPQTTNNTKEKDDIEGCQMFTLRVKEEIIDRGVTEIAALESSNVTMVCPVEGEVTNVTWWKMNKERERKQLENSERFVVFRPCSCQYRLTIINIQRTDTGHYLCQANRNLDSGIHHFKLSLKNPEEKPTVGSFAVIDSAKFLLILSGALFTWITMY